MLHQIRQNNIKVLPYLILGICAIGIIKLQSQHHQNSLVKAASNNYFLAESKQQEAINLQKITPSFGLNNLKADLLYLNYVQYLGDEEARNKTGYSLISDYFETIINHDPNFTEAYLTLATANSIYAGKPEKTVALMNQFLDSLSPEIAPEVSILWTYKGLDELLYLDDLQAAKKSYLTAAKWASKRQDKQGDRIAQNNRKTAKFIDSNPDTREAQILAWSMILPNIRDERSRQVVIDKIQALKSDLAAVNPENETN